MQKNYRLVFWLRRAFVALMFIASFSDGLTAQQAGQTGQTSGCQPPDIEVAAYDFVPDAQLQETDFRPLMKTETSFVENLRQTSNISLTDYPTQILPPEIMSEPPHI